MIHVIFGIGTSNQICGSKMLFLDFDEPITENVTFKVSITQNEVPLNQKVKVHICLENIDRQFISDVYYIFICSV